MCDFCESNAALHEAADDDDARDRAVFGGPITDAMLHTALRSCAYDPATNPQRAYNLASLAVTINSWLHPIANDDDASATADSQKGVTSDAHTEGTDA